MNLNMADAVIVQIDVSPTASDREGATAASAAQDQSKQRTRVSVYKAFGPEVNEVPFEYQLSG